MTLVAVQVPLLLNEDADSFLFVCSGVWIQCARVTEGLSVHPSSSGCTVYVGVYVSMCLLSAEKAGRSHHWTVVKFYFCIELNFFS